MYQEVVLNEVKPELKNHLFVVSSSMRMNQGHETPKKLSICSNSCDITPKKSSIYSNSYQVNSKKVGQSVNKKLSLVSREKHVSVEENHGSYVKSLFDFSICPESVPYSTGYEPSLYDVPFCGIVEHAETHEVNWNSLLKNMNRNALVGNNVILEKNQSTLSIIDEFGDLIKDDIKK